MKVIIDVPATAKKPRMVTVALHHDDEVLMSFRPNSHYRLDMQIKQVVWGSQIIKSDAAYWEAETQEWQI
jgi:hypothetical protein